MRGFFAALFLILTLSGQAFSEQPYEKHTAIYRQLREPIFLVFGFKTEQSMADFMSANVKKDSELKKNFEKLTADEKTQLDNEINAVCKLHFGDMIALDLHSKYMAALRETSGDADGDLRFVVVFKDIAYTGVVPAKNVNVVKEAGGNRLSADVIAEYKGGKEKKTYGFRLRRHDPIRKADVDINDIFNDVAVTPVTLQKFEKNVVTIELKALEPKQLNKALKEHLESAYGYAAFLGPIALKESREKNKITQADMDAALKKLTDAKTAIEKLP